MEQWQPPKADKLDGPKVLGKVELNPLHVKQSRKGWEEHYLHFAQRLKERYNLTINGKEYHSLSKSTDFKLIRMQDNHTKARIISIKFKDVDVKAVKGKGGLLTTALPRR